MATRGGEVAVEELEAVARAVRSHVLTMGATPTGAHVGGSLSVADVLTVLFFDVLCVDPLDPGHCERDRFILSKGHASAALYATLAERGFIDVGELASYGALGSRLAGHPSAAVPGVEFPTGSLGHGLSLGVGVALAAKRDGAGYRTFVVLGDGELQEGSVWEAAMFASAYGLDNLVAIVDRNGLQINGRTEQRIALEPLAERWRSFGWCVRETDGHDVSELACVLPSAPWEPGRPSVLIARTTKGRGVRFLEGRKKSHYVTLTPVLLERARNELGGGGR